MTCSPPITAHLLPVTQHHLHQLLHQLRGPIQLQQGRQQQVDLVEAVPHPVDGRVLEVASPLAGHLGVDPLQLREQPRHQGGGCALVSSSEGDQDTPQPVHADPGLHHVVAALHPVGLEAAAEVEDELVGLGDEPLVPPVDRAVGERPGQHGQQRQQVLGVRVFLKPRGDLGHQQGENTIDIF